MWKGSGLRPSEPMLHAVTEEAEAGVQGGCRLGRTCWKARKEVYERLNKQRGGAFRHRKPSKHACEAGPKPEAHAARQLMRHAAELERRLVHAGSDPDPQR